MHHTANFRFNFMKISFNRSLLCLLSYFSLSISFCLSLASLCCSYYLVFSMCMSSSKTMFTQMWNEGKGSLNKIDTSYYKVINFLVLFCFVVWSEFAWCMDDVLKSVCNHIVANRQLFKFEQTFFLCPYVLLGFLFHFEWKPISARKVFVCPFHVYVSS